MSGTALENKYLALLQKGFSQAELEAVATAGGDVLFKLPYKDGFCRVNARAVEINARALVPWAKCGRPSSFGSLTRAISTLDGMENYMLSGQSSKQGQKAWARDEADKLLMLITHMRLLFGRAPHSRSALLDRLKSIMRRVGGSDNDDDSGSDLPNYPEGASTPEPAPYKDDAGSPCPSSPICQSST